MNSKLITIGVLSLMMMSGAFAQNPNKQKGQRQQDGKSKDKTIDAADIDTALKAMTLSMDQKSKIADLVKEYLSGVNGALTPEQQEQLRLALAKASAPKSPVENLITSLSAVVELSPEQELKVKPVIEDALKSLRDKTKGLQPNERKQVTEQSMSDLKSALRGVLTAAQQAKLDGWKPSPRGRSQSQPGGDSGKKPAKP